jgi:hypothetical protein
MDKFCPYFGFYMSRRCCEAYGVAAINVFSNYMTTYFQKEHPELMEPKIMRMPSEDQFEAWLAQLPVDEIVGIICETDSGLADAERLGVMLKLKNHDGINEARRHKFLMVEEVGKAGLEVVRQKLCFSSEEAVEFAKELGLAEDAHQEVHQQEVYAARKDAESASNSGSLGMGTNSLISNENPMCIVKPVRGCASDNVYLCKKLRDVKDSFGLIHGSTIFGSPEMKHDSVLVQEFAYGTEYAIDIVSKDGDHKVAALWRYDKRPANGASFVYHATEVIDADNEVGRTVCDYAKRSLDSLGVQWGLSHTEVILGKDMVPRLVEVNCRQHNMDFAPLTMACIGYNALDMTLSAYLGGNDESTYPSGEEFTRLDWDSLPDLPVTRAYGAVVHLVNFANGILVSVNEDALNEIHQMESVLAMEIYPSFLEVGSPIIPTVDIRTDAGWVQIINDDKEAFQQDYERIVELMPTLFIVEDI